MHKSAAVSPYRNQQRLITRSTVLILSSWYIGAGTSHLLPPSAEQLALYTGATGLLAFVALEYAALRRKQSAAALSLGEIAAKLKCCVHPQKSARAFRSAKAASARRIRDWLASDAPPAVQKESQRSAHWAQM